MGKESVLPPGLSAFFDSRNMQRFLAKVRKVDYDCELDDVSITLPSDTLD